MALPVIKKIAVAGCGGIGSHLIHRLFDFGVNRNQFPFTDYTIDVYDDDAVDLKNLLHQNFEEGDVNESKAKIMANRYAVNGKVQLMTKADFKNYDLIFCCVDSMVFRTELYKWSWESGNKTFWIDGRCESRMGAVFNKSIPQKKLEDMLSDSQERTGCLLKYEKENNISHAMPIVVSAVMLQVFLNYIRGDEKQPEKIFMV
jgi:molybdopterin/thiamine biosynthesis adenylyltransferase